MLFQEFLNHEAHFRAGGVAFLPVDGAASAQGFGEFFGNRDQLVDFVKDFDRQGSG